MREIIYLQNLAPFGFTLDQMGALDSRLVLLQEVADSYPKGIPVGKTKNGKMIFIRVFYLETISSPGDIFPSGTAAPTGQPTVSQSSATPNGPSNDEIDAEIKRLQQKGAPAAGGPSDKAGAKKSPAEMTDEELLRELNR